MKKMRVVALITVLAVIMSFSGCAFRFSNFDSLLSPPRFSGDNQELHDAFVNEVGTDYILKMPENGDYRSSFIIYDCDSDGDNDALVFYSLKENPDAVMFRFFKHNSDKWVSSQAYDGLGNAVDTVMFSDVNFDEVPEIIIGWNFLSGKSNKVFGVYTASGDSIVFVDSYPYTYLSLTDVTGDDKADIFSLSIDSSNPEQLVGFARVYSYDAKAVSLDILSETRIDGNVSAFSKVSSETVDGIKYTYVEALKGQNDSITELIYWDDDEKKLVSPLFDETSQSTTVSWRNVNITSMDVDDDGFIEIPLSVEMKGSTSSDTAVNENNSIAAEDEKTSSMYFIKWVKYMNGKMKPVQYSIVNDKYSYMLNIQSSWVGRITANRTDGQIDVYRWQSYSEKTGELLFSICSYDNTDQESVKMYSTYKLLGSSANTSYVYRVTDDGYAFGIKEQSFKDEFIITDFGGTK